MDDDGRSKAQLMEELGAARRRLAELESARNTGDVAGSGLPSCASLTQFAIDRVSDAAFWMTAAGRFFYVNEAACRSLGYSRDELLAMRVHDIDPRFPEEGWSLHWQDVKERGSFTLESEHRTKDGRVFPVEVTVNHVEYEGEEYCCAFARDITVRQRDQEKLRLARFALDRANESAMWLGPDGRLLYVNDATCRSLGYSRDELLALKISDVDPNFPTDTWQERWQALKRRGTADIETTHRRKDGTSFPAWVHCNFLEFEGQEINCAFVRDLTERKRDEERLRFTQFAIDRAGEAAFWVGSDAQLIYVNEAACHSLGYSRDELLSMRLPDIAPEFSTELWARRWAQIKEVEVVTFDGLHRRKDGTLFPVEVTVNYFEFEGKEYNFSFARDATERKRAEEQLRLTQFAIDHAADAAFWVGTDNRFFYVNDAASRSLGYSRQELLTMGVTDINPDFTAELWTESQRRVKEEGSVSLEGFHRRKDGTLFTVEVTVTNAEFEGKEFNIAFARDITERKRAERQLGHTQFAVDHAGDSVFWIRVPGRKFIYVNDAACRALGYSRDELLNMTVDEIDPGYVAETWVGERQRIQAVGGFSLETRHRCKDGTTFPVEITLNYAEFEGIQYCCAFARDISERKVAEEQLRLTQFSIDRAADAVFWVRPDGYLSYVNNAASQLLGYFQHELLTMHVLDISPDFTHEMWPSHWRQIKEEGSFSFETRHRKKDGTIFPVEVTVNYVEFEGKEYNCAFARDITERKRAEEQLRLTQHAVERAGDAVFWIDVSSSRLVYVNEAACRNLGYSREELLAMSFPDVSPEFRNHDWNRDRERIQGAGAASFETYHRRKDGTTFPVEITLSYVSFEDAELMAGFYSCVYARDVTERKAAEEEKQHMEARIQQTQKLESLGVLAGGIAHDFNNLLTGILGNASLAQMDFPASSPAHEKVQQIEQSALRAADLTQQMLAYSGKGRFVVEPHHLNDLIREMTLIETVVSKKAVLKYDLVSDLPPVAVDATQIRQVIMNLLTNASDALEGAGGVIRVSTGTMEADREYLTETYLDEVLPEGSYVYIEVTDTGIGMDEETRAKIFDPFFTTKFAGRGLGLAAVLGIVRGHRGAIKVLSEPGRGTAIRLLLPATARRVDPNEEDVEARQEWRGSGTILVVDDEETVRIFARSMLSHFGFRVLTANDGHQALELYRSHGEEIAAVLLDMTMPRMDGEDTLRELRDLAPEVRVVLMSGYNEEDVAIRFAHLAPVSFVHKPFRPHELIAKLRETLG